MKRPGILHPRALRVVGGACAVLLGSLAILLDGSDEPRSAREVLHQESPTVTDQRNEDRAGGALVPTGVRRRRDRGRLPATTAENTERQQSLAERVRASVGALARALAKDHFDRRDWETRVAATACSFGPLAGRELRRIVGCAEVGGTELVAATELLRSLDDGTPGGSLPSQALARLRIEATRTDSITSVRVAASRSIGAFGERSDLLELTGRMVESADPAERSLARWALGAGSRTRVTGCVAELLSANPTPAAIERSLCFLSTRPGAPEPAPLDPGASALIAETARRTLRDGDTDESLRTRALQVLSNIEPDGARGDLIAVLSSRTAPVRIRQRAAEALLGSSDVVRVSDAERLLGSPDLSRESRRVLAEEILRAGSSPGSPLHAHPLREEALEIIEEAILDGGDPLRQRSALQVLAANPTHRTPAIIDRLLRGGPPPAVRAAARSVQER